MEKSVLPNINYLCVFDTEAQYSLSIGTSKGQRNRMETPGTDSLMHESVTGKEL